MFIAFACMWLLVGSAAGLISSIKLHEHLAIADPRIEFAKITALPLTGAVLPPSWRAAGLVVQAFFLGNLLPMMFVVATLYQDSPARLCDAYHLDDQQQLGRAPWWVSAAIAAAWLVPRACRLATADRPGGTPRSRTFE